eukprot:scaffold17826_cov114-Isochrysis_galbana.AAC.6
MLSGEGGGGASSPDRWRGPDSGVRQCKCRLPPAHVRQATRTSPGARPHTGTVRERAVPAAPLAHANSAPRCRMESRSGPCTEAGITPPHSTHTVRSPRALKASQPSALSRSAE